MSILSFIFSTLFPSSFCSSKGSLCIVRIINPQLRPMVTIRMSFCSDRAGRYAAISDSATAPDRQTRRLFLALQLPGLSGVKVRLYCHRWTAFSQPEMSSYETPGILECEASIRKPAPAQSPSSVFRFSKPFLFVICVITILLSVSSQILMASLGKSVSQAGKTHQPVAKKSAKIFGISSSKSTASRMPRSSTKHTGI